MNLTARPGLVGAILDPRDYIPQPMPLWQRRDSSERQRAQFTALCETAALMALTLPVALVAWPMILERGTR